jgi:uncharacterized membrane protein
MSLMEVAIVLFCGGTLFLILALGAWVLINKSKLDAPPDHQAKLEALDREYATGDLDEDEYDRRREQILNDRMR